MRIRNITPTDETRIQELMLAKEWPLPADGLFASRLALEDGNGLPVAFGVSRIITEAYLILDPNWRTPAWRWQALQMIHNAARDETVAKGYRKCITWIPSAIERTYGKRLMSLGWQKQEYPSFVLEVPL